MVKKKLIFHLYVGEDFETNIGYQIHFKCLKHYINIFDSIVFVVCIDKELRKEFLMKVYKWVDDLNFNGEISINVVENTFLREAITFKNYVVDANISEEFVFFAHSKGITNLRDETINQHGIIIWIILMYFYNLNFIREVENIFTGENTRPEIFYGSPLVKFNNEAYPVLGHRSACEYSGTFFWINGPRFYNCRKIGAFPDIVIGGRDFAEQYPGYFCDREIYGQGLASHNDACLDGHSFNLYNLTLDEWRNVIDILGDTIEFSIFYDHIVKPLEI